MTDLTNAETSLIPELKAESVLTDVLGPRVVAHGVRAVHYEDEIDSIIAGVWAD